MENIAHWISIYEYYIGPYSSSENDRVFRAVTGVHPEVAEVIYQRYGYYSSFTTRMRLFMAFYYLKVYPTEDSVFKLFKYGTPATYRKHLWETLHCLDHVMDEIHLENRFEGPVATQGLFEGIALVIDGTDVPIERPNKDDEDSATQIWRRKMYFSGRDKENSRSKYCLKYTVGVQVSTGKICFIDGPRPGSMSDITALRESGYIDKNVPNLLTPIKKPPLRSLLAEQQAFNQIVSSVRIIVERSIGRIKIFDILTERFRKGSCKIENHRVIFNVCTQITNISLEREPLSYSDHPFIY